MIPAYHEIMLPLLKLHSDQKSHHRSSFVKDLSNEFGLSESELSKKLQSGNQTIIDNRIGWAYVYLKKAGLLEQPERGYYQITNRGRRVLTENLEKITPSYLKKFDEFNQFYKPDPEDKNEGVISENLTPDDLIEQGFKQLNQEVKVELLNLLRQSSPDFFEQVVLDLMEKMGYGIGKVTGKTGDGGIDGIINQDALGLDKVYLQAKRFAENNKVSASMLRDFVGSLELHGASKGVFITTSDFPKNARDLIKHSPKSISLIASNDLVEYMLKYDLGVDTKKVYKVKAIDTDYFLED